MRTIIYVLLAFLCSSATVAANPGRFAELPAITGPLTVIDGDTIRIGDTRIRLHGIDTPERRQTCQTEHDFTFECGEIVRDWVTERWEGATAHCVWHDFAGRSGRPVMVCRVDGIDIGGALVDAGLAWAYEEYSADYKTRQEIAVASEIGLWAVIQDAPWDYRAELREVRRTAARAQVPPDPGCAIKGNISASGRIYHVPGGADYDATVISTERGERWFCSSEEAEREGWRAPRR